jgi:hypothetical protein
VVRFKWWADVGGFKKPKLGCTCLEHGKRLPTLILTPRQWPSCSYFGLRLFSV